MNYLTLEHVSKSYGDKVLFSDLSLRINKGDKVALVARNGAGKTTLLRLLGGTEKGEGEHCTIELAKDIRVGSLSQEPQFNEQFTVLETIFSGNSPVTEAVRAYECAMLFPDRQQDIESALARMDDLQAWDFEAMAKEILYKLNITSFDQPVHSLSGGQRKRLALAQILIEEPEFLILDEPTNHLDFEMIEWLENYLAKPNKTLFLVTHDRYFLDRLCNYIVELDRGVLHKYSGNYSDFLLKKATRHQNEFAAKDKASKLMKKELAWIRRMPKARGTKAKSRVNAFEDIKTTATVNIDEPVLQLDILGQRLGSKILELQYISKSYSANILFKDFHYKFKKNERVGIVGKNGTGKTTLLKILTGELQPDQGKVITGSTVKFGHYAQDGLKLKRDRRTIDVVRDIAEYIPLAKGQKLSASQLLERFLFTPDKHQVYASQLSGGEQRRLYLLTILMSNPNFLILDEPTNDLDVLTLNVLEDFLFQFPGCVVIVSHDRFFMDKIVDHIFVIEGDATIRDFNGNYTQYRNWLDDQPRVASSGRATAVPKAKTMHGDSGLTYERSKQIKRIENAIRKYEEKKADLTEEFNNPDISPDQIAQYAQELASLNSLIEAKELEWMELVDSRDQIS